VAQERNARRKPATKDGIALVVHRSFVQNLHPPRLHDLRCIRRQHEHGSWLEAEVHNRSSCVVAKGAVLQIVLQRAEQQRQPPRMHDGPDNFR
jgi:hypothetical protein